MRSCAVALRLIFSIAKCKQLVEAHEPFSAVLTLSSRMASHTYAGGPSSPASCIQPVSWRLQDKRLQNCLQQSRPHIASDKQHGRVREALGQKAAIKFDQVPASEC